MDYEKLHKDTIAKLQEMVNRGKITAETARGICADFVPESEDKMMIKFIKNQLFNIKKTITENYKLDAKLTKAIDWLENQGEQKPAWSEDDEDILNTIINHFKVDIECTDEDDMVRWLKSIKDRVQPKQEWSEDDESRRKKIIHILSLDGRIKNEELSDINNWLKSLRPQNTWKPTLAQLNALSIVSKGNAPDDIEAIVSLFNDLKKLREE